MTFIRRSCRAAAEEERLEDDEEEVEGEEEERRPRFIARAEVVVFLA